MLQLILELFYSKEAMKMREVRATQILERGLLASTISLSNKTPPSPLASLCFLLICSASGQSLFPDSDHPTMHLGL